MVLPPHMHAVMYPNCHRVDTFSFLCIEHTKDAPPPSPSNPRKMWADLQSLLCEIPWITWPTGVCVCVPERLPVRIRAWKSGREPGDPEDVWFSAQSCSTAAEGSVTVKRTTQLKVNAPAMLRFFLCVCFVSTSRTGVGGVQSIFPFKKQIRVKHVLKVYWSKIKGEWNTHVHTFSSGSDLED